MHTEKNPDFSIIISTVGSKRLSEVLGVFLDNYESVEILLVLDMPGLNPLEFLTDTIIHDPRVKIFANEKNIGPTASFNKALRLSRADIAVRADDDDIPEPERLKEIGSYFAAHAEIDLVFSFAKGVDIPSGRSWVIDGPLDDASIKKNLLKRNFIVHSSLAFRRNRIDAIGFYDESFRFAQDYDLYLRSIRAGYCFGCIPKVLVTRYYHSQSITVSRRKKQILNSLAARLLHVAWLENTESVWPVLKHYVYLMLIPNWVRSLRRKMGFGK